MSNDENRESMPETARRAWQVEIERRIREIDDGTVKMIPWDQARTMILSQEHPKRRLPQFLTRRSP